LWQQPQATLSGESQIAIRLKLHRLWGCIWNLGLPHNLQVRSQSHADTIMSITLRRQPLSSAVTQPGSASTDGAQQPAGTGAAQPSAAVSLHIDIPTSPGRPQLFMISSCCKHMRSVKPPKATFRLHQWMKIQQAYCIDLVTKALHWCHCIDAAFLQTDLQSFASVYLASTVSLRLSLSPLSERAHNYFLPSYNYLRGLLVQLGKSNIISAFTQLSGCCNKFQL
jgi:hypothetical protein